MKNIFRKQNSDGSTESAAMSLEDGSKNSACGPIKESPVNSPLPTRWSRKDPAVESALTSGRGIEKRRQPVSTGPDTPEKPSDFSVRLSDFIEQDILDRNGKVVAWTTDAALAYRIVRLLNGE